MPICAVALLSATALAGQDAAQEVQEGNVQQWMEYYERERGRADERDAMKDTTSESGQTSNANKAQPGGAAAPDAALTKTPDRD